jgi:succinate dehydrogenase / fumarate reductase membrane anchor subunit
MSESIRSPLGKARGLGSAKDGVHHWWMQRVSAVALLPLTLFLVVNVGNIATSSHYDFTRWLASPVNAVAVILFILTSFYHAVLGLQVVIEDYVHGEGYKFTLLIANKIFFFFAAIAGVFAVTKINLGL